MTDEELGKWLVDNAGKYDIVRDGSEWASVDGDKYISPVTLVFGTTSIAGKKSLKDAAVAYEASKKGIY